MAKGKDRASFVDMTYMKSRAKRPQTKGHAGPSRMTVAEGKTPLTASIKAQMGFGKSYNLTSVEAERIRNERNRTAMRKKAAQQKAAVKKAEAKKLNPNKSVLRTGIARTTSTRTTKKK